MSQVFGGPANHELSLEGFVSSSGNYFEGQYQTTAGYAARFAINSLDENSAAAFDPESIVADSLWRIGVPIEANIVDMSAADGHFLDQLALSGFTGTLIGIDPNSSQFNSRRPWSEGSDYPLDEKLLVKADANNVPLRDNSVDVYASQFAMYHYPDTDGAIMEAKRVLNDSGIFVVTTSGVDNKREHRDDEARIAEYLSDKTGVETRPPEKMNKSYTTEYACEDLPRFFPNVYCRNYESRAVFRTRNERAMYARSLLSLWDQFSPIPDAEAFVEAVRCIAIEGVTESVAISRSVILASQRRLRGLDKRFEPVTEAA